MHLPRLTRFTIGAKIDSLFIQTIELCLLAEYSSREQKLEIIQKISTKFDALKFFIKLLWEIKAIDNKKYLHISKPLAEIGKIIGGWLKLIKNPVQKTGK